MILSSAAQMLNGSGGGLPPWLPDGAIAHMDLKTGDGYAGGAARSIDEMLGGGFDPAALSASGLRFIESNSNRPKAIGPLLADISAGLAAGCTVRFVLNFLNAPYGFAMFIGDNTNWDTSSDGITVAVDDEMYDAVSLGLGAPLGSTGIHKLAVTLNRDVGGGDYEYAWCLDGAAATTQTVPYAASWLVNTILFGWDGVDDTQLLDNVYWEGFTLWQAKLPAGLPPLTA
ncbi:hypothetical protein [Mesorhizobium amorphae]|uniref:hypothetical protein n=1 Tax=Mesorhizobium amorphae TaxID=71433 RepID=UPI001784D46B|nr:hypothetical protein [Mesorhizobium amorphae]